MGIRDPASGGRRHGGTADGVSITLGGVRGDPAPPGDPPRGILAWTASTPGRAPARHGTAAELAAELRRAGLAEVSDTALRRALYSTDASLYRVVPRSVVRPRDADEVAAALGGVPAARRPADHAAAPARRSPATPSAPAWCWTSPGTSTGVLAVDPRGAHRDRSSRASCTPTLQRAAAAARAALRARPVDPHPLHHRRDDRQQRLRLARARLRPDRRQRARPGGAHRHGRAADRLDGPRRRRRRRRRRRSCDALVATAHLATIRTEFGRFGRQVSGYAWSTCCPSAASTSPGVPGRQRGHARRRHSARPCGWSRDAAAPRAGRARLPDMADAADAVPALLPHAPAACEGLDRRIVDVVRARRGRRRRARRCRAAPAGCSSRSTGDDAGEALSAGRAGRRDRRGAGRPGGRPTPRRPRRCGGSARTAPAWPADRRAARPPTPAGRTPRCRRSGSARYLRDFDALLRRPRARPAAVRPLRRRLRARAASTSRSTGPAAAPCFREFLREAARAGRRLRRLAVRRARRRPGPLRAAAARCTPPAAMDAVRPGQGTCSTRTTCSTPACWSARGRWTPTCGRPRRGRCRAAAATLGWSARRRRLRGGRAPLHRRRQVRGRHHRRRRRHVPVVPGDPGREGLHPRPGPGAAGDGQRHAGQRRLAGARGARGARPVPVLQGLCSADCPTGIDMAAYKAEVLHQAYRRPAAARAATTRSAGCRAGPGWPRGRRGWPTRRSRRRACGRLARLAAGIDPRRCRRPRPFAPRRFRRRARRAPSRRPRRAGRRWCCWVDSFTDFFAPEIGQAARPRCWPTPGSA